MSVILQARMAGSHKTSGPQKAPGELELVRQFVNTRDVEHSTDLLDSPATANAWLTEQKLPGAGNLDRSDLERLSSVREALRGLLLANNAGEAPPRAAVGELNRQSSEGAIGLRFDSDSSQLVTTCEGVDSTIARLLSIVHESMGSGTWERLKACPADDCLWAFYDRSRNHSRTWCEMEDCGNRAKARAYRERRRSSGAR
jgi:predicted RNA-binding Zn ribbon-like protein